MFSHFEAKNRILDTTPEMQNQVNATSLSEAENLGKCNFTLSN